MKVIPKVLAVLISLASFFVVFYFRTIPAEKLWNEYSILYVPVNTPDNVVFETLETNGIPGEEVVSLSGQYMPVTFSENSLELTLFRVFYTGDENGYDKRRNSYFFDKSGDYQLYYIPADYEVSLNKAVKSLNKNKIKSGTDVTTAYPWVLPIVVLVVSLFLFAFSKQKRLFLPCTILPICFILCNPFYPVAFTDILLLVCVFFISNVWKRKGAAKYIITRPYVIVMMVTAILCGFAASVKTGLLFFVTLLTTACIIFVAWGIHVFSEGKKSFHPLLIKPARKKSLFAGKARIVAPVLSLAGIAVLGLLFFNTSSAFTETSDAVMVHLPAEDGELSDRLPALDEYSKWIWDIQVGPYKSLNGFNDDNELTEVVYPRYYNENGKIVQRDYILSYNESYKQGVLENIDNLNFNSIEKVLKSQSVDFKGCYSVVSSFSISRFGIITMILAVCVLLFLAIFTIIGKGIVK